MADGVGGKLSTRFFAAAAPICTKHHVCVRSPNVFLSLCTEHKSAEATKKKVQLVTPNKREKIWTPEQNKKKATIPWIPQIISAHSAVTPALAGRAACSSALSRGLLSVDQPPPPGRWRARERACFDKTRAHSFAQCDFFLFLLRFFCHEIPRVRKFIFFFHPRALARSQLFFLLASAERWREKNGPPRSRLLCTSQHHHRHRHQFFLHVLTQHVEYIVGTASPPPTTTRGPPLFFRISVGARRAGQPAARKKTSTHEQRAKVRIFQLPSLINWRGSSFPRGGKFGRNILTVSQSNFGCKCV